MRKVISCLVLALLINLGIENTSAYANLEFPATKQPTVNQTYGDGSISYDELDMFVSIARNGELNEGELRNIVSVLKNCGLTDKTWFIKNSTATPAHQWDGYKPEPWEKFFRNEYTYTKKNVDLGYRTFARNPATGNIATKVSDIKFTLNIIVAADTKQVDRVNFYAYSYLGGMFFPGYDYPISDKYVKTIALYKNGSYNAKLNDIKISEQYLQSTIEYFLEDLQKQYGDNHRLVCAEYNPIFNAAGDVFTEVMVEGKLTKQVYGEPEGKDIKKFAHDYIFDKNGVLVDCIRKIENLSYG